MSAARVTHRMRRARYSQACRRPATARGGGGGGRRYVMRKKPPGQLLASAHQGDREFRIMKALAQTAVPVSSLVIFLVLAALLGLVAATWPARRAARLDVLAAIASR